MTKTDDTPAACPRCADAYRAGELAGLATQQTLIDEYRALFDLQWTRMHEAIALWQAEDPDARRDTWPDLGNLLAWLMARAEPKGTVNE